MDLYRIQELHRRDKKYFEFARTTAFSAGVYRIRAGASDPQLPHEEDELYYVVTGRARFTAGRRTVAVAGGHLIFVPAREDHRFHDVEEDLEILVLFAPPEGSRN
jgi:mannose-6-phosphate isomerase-like protein (cupin superfamily)